MSDVFNLQKILHPAHTSWYTSMLSSLFMRGLCTGPKVTFFFLASLDKRHHDFHNAAILHYNLKLYTLPRSTKHWEKWPNAAHTVKRYIKVDSLYHPLSYAISPGCVLHIPVPPECVGGVGPLHCGSIYRVLIHHWAMQNRDDQT